MIIITIGIVALLIFLIRRNQKDEKKIEEELNSSDSISREASSHSDDENKIN